MRMDGIFALDLWDVVIEVSHSSNNNTPPTQNSSANEGRAKGAVENCLQNVDISQRLILNHGRWMRSTLLHDRAIKLSKAKVHVYSDSVLCLGKMQGYVAAMDKWKEQNEWFFGSEHHQELHAIDGVPLELECNIFQDTLQWNHSTRLR